MIGWRAPGYIGWVGILPPLCLTPPNHTPSFPLMASMPFFQLQVPLAVRYPCLPWHQTQLEGLTTPTEALRREALQEYGGRLPCNASSRGPTNLRVDLPQWFFTGYSGFHCLTLGIPQVGQVKWLVKYCRHLRLRQAMKGLSVTTSHRLKKGGKRGRQRRWGLQGRKRRGGPF